MIVNKYILYIFFLFSGIFFSCSEKELNAVDYISWIENDDNGLKVIKEFGKLVFEIQYKPYDYIIVKEEKNTVFHDELAKKVSELEELQYFTFRIRLKDQSVAPIRFNLSDETEYNRRLEYFSFSMKNDMFLVEGADTLDCVLYHFEPDYGITSNNTFVLAFRLPGKSDEYADKTFIYLDNIFEAGTVKMKISKKSLKNIPKLKL
ncbi:MAG: hypothetical protein HY738_16170 [Bacteroidia bacterium]|nr:hypothetical protein [Bacteroidia bacterium]